MSTSKLAMLALLIISFGNGNTTAENLFNEKEFQSLTADKKAHRIGDTVTIMIVERATAESRAATGTQKSLEIKGSASDQHNFPKVGVGIGMQSSGDAVTRRNGFVSGQITVTVLNVNDLGHLVVKGQQQIVINGEEQSIKVQGTLRQEDIQANNTVLSTRLTNAQIEFIGAGIVSDTQKRGLIASIFNWLGIL